MSKILTLEEKRNEAIKIVEEIQTQKESVSALLANIKVQLLSVNHQDRSYKKLRDALEQISSKTQDAITQFNDDRRNVAALLKQANAFYSQKYLPLQSKITDPATGFAVKIQNTNKEYQLFLKIKKECGDKYAQIAEQHKNFVAKTKELLKIEVAIRDLHKISETNSGKIGKLYEGAKIAIEEVTTLQTNIKNLNQESADRTKEIIHHERVSKSKTEQITGLHETAEDRLREIEKVYQISHETGLSGEFNERRKQLGIELDNWSTHIRWTTVALLCGILGLFVTQLWLNEWVLNETLDLNLYIRFLVFSPIVYYLYFVSVQYNKAKKLYDKYAFKTTLSLSIRSHIELLTQHGYFNGEEASQKILNFVIEGFNTIYREPYENEDSKMKIKLANFEIDLQKKLIGKLSVAREEIENRMSSVL